MCYYYSNSDNLSKIFGSITTWINCRLLHSCLIIKINFSAKVNKLVLECLQKRKTLKFVDLWNVENWVINEQASKSEIRSFEDFGHGSFLKFITSDKILKDRVISNLDMHNGISGISSGTGSMSKEDIKEFIKQCYAKTSSKVNNNELLII